MMLSKWWLTKAAVLYRWLEKDAKNDSDVSYEEYKKVKKYADDAGYLIKSKSNT